MLRNTAVHDSIYVEAGGTLQERVLRKPSKGSDDGNRPLSFVRYGIHIFYRNRDKAVQAAAGFRYIAQCIPWQSAVLRLLLRTLGLLYIGCSLSPEPFSCLDRPGLFLDRPRHCLAWWISVGGNELDCSQSWKVKWGSQLFEELIGSFAVDI
jgi:hypothetical protein